MDQTGPSKKGNGGKMGPKAQRGPSMKNPNVTPPCGDETTSRL